jgi:hypothetical protein
LRSTCCPTRPAQTCARVVQRAAARLLAWRRSGHVGSPRHPVRGGVAPAGQRHPTARTGRSHDTGPSGRSTKPRRCAWSNLARTRRVTVARTRVCVTAAVISSAAAAPFGQSGTTCSSMCIALGGACRPGGASFRRTCCGASRDAVPPRGMCGTGPWPGLQGLVSRRPGSCAPAGARSRRSAGIGAPPEGCQGAPFGRGRRWCPAPASGTPVAAPAEGGHDRSGAQWQS